MPATVLVSNNPQTEGVEVELFALAMVKSCTEFPEIVFVPVLEKIPTTVPAVAAVVFVVELVRLATVLFEIVETVAPTEEIPYKTCAAPVPVLLMLMLPEVVE